MGGRNESRLRSAHYLLLSSRDLLHYLLVLLHCPQLGSILVMDPSLYYGCFGCRYLPLRASNPLPYCCRSRNDLLCDLALSSDRSVSAGSARRTPGLRMDAAYYAVYRAIVRSTSQPITICERISGTTN